jgi:hypothetical protein
MKGPTPSRTTNDPTTYPVSTKGTWRNLWSGQRAGDYTRQAILEMWKGYLLTMAKAENNEINDASEI